MATALQRKPSSKEHYFADLWRLGRSGAPGWLEQLRSDGAARFRAMDYPHTRMEGWRQTNIGPIIETPYRSLVEPTQHGLTPGNVAPFFYGPDVWAELVFVDGFFSLPLSTHTALPRGVRIGGIADAIDSAESVAARHLNRYLRPRNAYAALNTAFLQHGAFVHVPRDVHVETPIHLVFIATDRGNAAASHVRNLIVLDSGSKATIVVSYVSLAAGTAYLNNVAEEVVLGPQAHLTQYTVVEEGAGGNHLATAAIHQGGDSRYSGLLATLGGAIVRNEVCIELAETGAACSLHGLYLNDGGRLIDNTLDITHAAPHCSSRINCRGVLEDESRTVFAGSVHVQPQAQQTDSNQLNKNLLLSPLATIDTKPQLEIYADDVKCTHGAAVGAPPDEVLFYFRSRGIGEARARAMLTQGFTGEIVDEIGLEALRARLRRHIVNKYSAEA